jgi:hypothetical protein
MKTVKVVFYQSGEINGTFDPKCFLENFTGNIEDTCTRLVSHDMWEPITVNLYKIGDVSMPQWMCESEYLSEYIKLKFAIAQGMPLTFNRTQYYNFTRLSEKYQYFITWLFEKHSNTKNEFMLSIVEQVKNWLEAEDHKFDKPLSNRQSFSCLKILPAL